MAYVLSDFIPQSMVQTFAYNLNLEVNCPRTTLPFLNPIIAINGNISAPTTTGVAQTPTWNDYWTITADGVELFTGRLIFDYTYAEFGDYRYYWCIGYDLDLDYIKYYNFIDPEYRVLYLNNILAEIIYCIKYNAISGEHEFFNFIFRYGDFFDFMNGETQLHAGIAPYSTVTFQRNIPNQILSVSEVLTEATQRIYYKQIDTNKFNLNLVGTGCIGCPVAISSTISYPKDTIVYHFRNYNYGGVLWWDAFKFSQLNQLGNHNLYNITPTEFKYKALLSYMNQQGSVENINYEL